MSRTRQPAVNSQLQTTTESRDSSTVRLTGTLRLRGDDSPHPTEPASARRIRWSEDVVDNEGMGKKSSKGRCSDPTPLARRTDSSHCPVCCIYHKSRPVGESSSESESSDSSSSESDSDSETDRRRRRVNNPRHSHPRGRRRPDQDPAEHPREQNAGDCCAGNQHTRHKRRKPSPNAYEKMPKPSKNQSRPT
jgi:protein phosphatase 1 regulatory subunit 11